MVSFGVNVYCNLLKYLSTARTRHQTYQRMTPEQPNDRALKRKQFMEASSGEGRDYEKRCLLIDVGSSNRQVTAEAWPIALKMYVNEKTKSLKVRMCIFSSRFVSI